MSSLSLSLRAFRVSREVGEEAEPCWEKEQSVGAESVIPGAS